MKPFLRRAKAVLLVAGACASLAGAAYALNVEPALPDPAAEARAQALFHQIRCVVCQGETIADSPAKIAGDMRQDVRSRVQQGQTNKTILAELVARYGDQVLMHPPLKSGTYLLWFGPLLMVMAAGLLAWRYFKTQTTPKPW